MPSESGVISPPVVEWTLTGKAGKFKSETRVFYQSELTIDGEVSILSLASRAVATLSEAGFPLAELGNLQKDDGELDVALAGRLASQAAPIVPSLASESAAIFFGYYPTDDFGRRNPEYDETVAFLRAALTIPRWLDILNIFTDQNDWKRMSAPFVGALRKGVEMGLWAERIKSEQSATSTLPESSTNSSLPDTENLEPSDVG